MDFMDYTWSFSSHFSLMMTHWKPTLASETHHLDGVCRSGCNCHFSIRAGSSWCGEEEERGGRGGGGHISFSFSSCRAHSSSPFFDETREQTWEEGGDLWPTEVCQPVKAVALLMNSQSNQRGVRGGHRSAVVLQEAASCSLKPSYQQDSPSLS